MATTSLPVNKITVAGVAPVTEVAADNVNGNHLAVNDGRSVWVEATNGGGGSATILLTTSAVGPGGRAVADDTITIAASGKRKIGPFPLETFGSQPVLTASASTVTFAAYMV